MPASKSDNETPRTIIYGSLVVIVALAVVGVVFAPDNTVNILGFCGVAITGLFAHLSTLRTAEKVEETVAVAAQKVEEVKVALIEKDEKQVVQLEGIVKMGERNHILLNSNHLAQLKISAVALRRISDITKDEKDAAAANLAEGLLHEHEAKQKSLDVKDAKDAKDKP